MSDSTQDHNTLFKYREEDKKSRIMTTLKESVMLVTPPILLQMFSKLKN